MRQQSERLESSDTASTSALHRRQHVGYASPDCANDLAASTLLDHLLSCRTVAIEHTIDVDLKHLLDIFFAALQDWLDLSDAGIGNHHIELPQLLDCRGDETFDFGKLRNVCYVTVGLASKSFNLLHGLRGLAQGADN